jgi:hypothetical protein
MGLILRIRRRSYYYKTIAVGIRRPPTVFFFDVDKRDSLTLKKLLKYCNKYFKNPLFYSIYLTKNGYHVIAYPFRKKIFRAFKRAFKSDYTMKLRKKFASGGSSEMVLRISPKWELRSGKKTSDRPKKIIGNFEILNLGRYFVLYPSVYF